MGRQLDTRALSGLTERDRALFAGYGVGPAVRLPHRRVQDAIGAVARRWPEALAVTHRGERLTYRELDRRANALAHELVARGVRPGDRVGLLLRRSVPMVVGILAILKAGAAYVPQDARITPPGHLAHIVAAAGTDVVLTLAEFTDRVPDGPAVIALDRFDGVADHGPVVRPAADDTAVVIFTSGTTGRPNGVRVTHTNLCNVLLAGPASLGIRPGQRVAQLLNIAFDMAAWEILGALTHGATLVVRGADIEETARAADVVIATPSVLAGLDARRCRGVRTVAVAGERCPQTLADTWAAFSAFHNSCGPTEVTIVNTLERYRPGRELTIGRPLPNTTVYVLDELLRPCPIGQVGEMWAGGLCVTAGYLGNDELTAERYRPDPFLGGAHRMFRTRDLGRWTASGELQHHGRTDDQVKVRGGFRVELDAVTGAMERTPGVRRATTALRDGELVAFVTPAGVDRGLVTATVAAALPYYCVPSLVVPVDELPVTDRGKVDRRRLLATLDAPSSPVALVGAVA
ncbi:MAG TPA: amino acid adenylation domain-containing protein [Pseudonocardiaceae bacterium]